ncbi:bacillithiol system redox-active protein YtxJ [Bacillus shivajii]|uniref:bacillithiol system redox-active protein YtxJ n=1 Tax=Bacillus shivajii TaxID=1983719 RepID=UPI001CFB31B4|nr:bacillithiol system redox-active protein YtxJ [Bacillus shivajii]UCZ52313.1 bacillithiol system redox-active protein YtxJ [Bacillus shivajii]
MGIKKIESIDQFDELYNEKTAYFFLKNSTTCPISHEGYKEVEKFSADHEDLPVYYLNVQDSRELSNHIAEKFGVKHESPQVLLFDDGDVIWHDSHWNITKKSLTNAWANK